MFEQYFVPYPIFIKSLACRSASSLYSQLAEHNSKPIGVADGQRLLSVFIPMQR